jgi:hypothetical protein
MGLPPQLETDINKLKETGYSVVVHRENNQILVVIEKYRVPSGWNKSETTLLLVTDIGYPNSKMDMFWTDLDFKLSGERIPQAGDTVQPFIGKQWRRFSWHVQKWNPAVDNVITYLGTVDARLRQLQ